MKKSRVADDPATKNRLARPPSRRVEPATAWPQAIEPDDLVEVAIDLVRGHQHALGVGAHRRRGADAVRERGGRELVRPHVLVDAVADDDGALHQLAPRVLLFTGGNDAAEGEAEHDHRADRQRDHAVEDLDPERRRRFMVAAHPGARERPGREDLHQERLRDAVQRLLQRRGGRLAGVGLQHAGAPAVEERHAGHGPEPGRGERRPEPLAHQRPDRRGLEDGDEHQHRVPELPRHEHRRDDRGERRPGRTGGDRDEEDDHHVEAQRQPRRERRRPQVRDEAEEPRRDGEPELAPGTRRADERVQVRRHRSWSAWRVSARDRARPSARSTAPAC